ncbi:acyltransferase [Winogradskyella thalassocola]|uniref:Hexapeptide repeat of succinyl-transferase n=1 Tax=Winogradskyella thalassocola TaxID=262004 RepID=A0A1G7Z0I2_9FLAO|nr:acyltransferase [Winogradskyella thalassocola]SDH02282.1 Hexapeptide repeat of succinyl-transferase [Winogradskyella thalassocola]
MTKKIILIKIFLTRLKFKVFYGAKVRVKTLYNSGSFIFDITYKTIDMVTIESVNFREFCSVRMRNNASLHIGKGVFFNNFCSINCCDDIKIGNNCIFGENVKIYDHDHVFKNPNIPFREQGFKSKPIAIGNNCWIGSNVTILKGVEIGDNVVVGANVLLSQSIPSNSIVKSEQNLKIEKLKW